MPGGMLFLQTDNAGYWHYLREVVPALFDFHVQDRTWPDAPKGRTRREIIALRRGLTVYRGYGVRRDLTLEQAQAIAEKLPAPAFDAGPRDRDIDEIERTEV